MSKTFVISIEGDANAAAFLDAIQETKRVTVKVSPGKVRTVPVLFIYPTSDLVDEPDKPDHRPNPRTGRNRRGSVFS